MKSTMTYAAAGIALLGAAGAGLYYFIRHKNKPQEPYWAKKLRARINIVRYNTLLNWEFIGLGGGGGGDYSESANYACWRYFKRADGSLVRDMDAEIEMWRSADGNTFTIEVYHAAEDIIYLDGEVIEHNERHMTRFVLG